MQLDCASAAFGDVLPTTPSEFEFDYMAIISVNHLEVARGGKRILQDVSFDIQEGEVFALLGGNGVGKSTTLLTLLGFLKPSAGSISILGHSPEEKLADIRQQVAYLPESASLYGHLSAYENIEYFLSLAKLNRTQEQMEDALDRVNLQKSQRSKNLDQYSKGMRQKVAIALALLRDTPILLMDEPTSGLDPVAIDEFNQLLKELSNQGRTILMVTHDVYGACQVAHRIGLLKNGSIVDSFTAKPGQQVDTASVHEAFAKHR